MAQKLALHAFRYAFIVMLCLVLALVFQETWAMQRDYIAMERARRFMASITPTPRPPTPRPTAKPTPGPTPSPTPIPTPTPRVYIVNPKYGGFLAQNPDFTGWLTIADTPIDYPVVQADDNEHYLHFGFDGQPSDMGTLFLDYRCAIDTEFPPHFIIYGHHMKNGTMFKGLMRFKEKDYFDTHRVFRFDTLYDDMEWEVFSVFITESTDPYIQTDFQSKAEWLAFIEALHERSMFPTPEITLTGDDVVLTLSTCTYESELTDGRFTVNARLVRRNGIGIPAVPATPTPSAEPVP